MTYVLPVLAALFIWWFSTGIILLLDRLPKQTHFWSQMIASVLGMIAFGILVAIADNPTVEAAYAGFTASIIIWGWHELAFLLGIVTGPRRAECPPGAGFWRRFVLAFQTLAYHELAILMTLGLIALATWGAENQVGLWTFLVLFGMRLSAKLNIFLGVPHLNEELLPAHLDFLKSYFSKRAMNALFPLSITISTLAGAYVFHAAFMNGASTFEVTAYMLTGSLILLGTLEHWLLVINLPDTALWRWALKNHEDAEPSATYSLDPSPMTQRLPHKNAGHFSALQD